jgi:hypothetical protein
MSTTLRSSHALGWNWICAPIVAFGFGACASEVTTSADQREVAVVGEALSCSADLDCFLSSQPICEGGQCVECTVDEHCWWDQVCSKGQCIIEPETPTQPETPTLYEACEASGSAQGNCGANMLCLAVGGTTPHCLSAGPCAGFQSQSFGFCAQPCSGNTASGGFVSNATGCPAGAQRCWENALTEPSNDGWCIP